MESMMKNTAIKLAVLGALGVVTTQVAMADWTNLPATGVSVGGNTSPYLLCNTTGDFGSGITTKPTSNSDACARILTFETQVPDPTYTGFSSIPVASATRTITMNNTYTNFSNVNVGELRELVWRKSSGGVYECIYGVKINLNNVDYNLLEAGFQTFEVNDIARGGWGNVDLDIAYSTYAAVADPTYRAGRTFTSVQRRNETGYVNQPLTPGSTASINGVNTYPTPSGQPTAAQQSAQLNSNWVDFTADVNFQDDDGSSVAASGWYYVRTACSSAAPVATANAIRLRQTFQELAGDGTSPNPFIEVPMTGFILDSAIGGGSVTPAPNAPTNPY